MDGGVKQEEMADQLKREVKEKAHRRSEKFSVPLQEPSRDLASPISDLLRATNVQSSPMSLDASALWLQNGPDIHSSQDAGKAFGQSDAVLFVFYFDTLFPFLYPFYRPSLLQGGRAWILEMMNRPVVRQAALCQSAYFFSLALGTADIVWDKVLTQTRDAFEVLKQALQVLDGLRIEEHLYCAVRIMASVMQLQRFEIAVLSFDNWQAHLNGALALFRQLLDSSGAVEPACPRSRFNAVISRLGPSSWIFPTEPVQIPSAEQAAFRFSSTLVIFDDIIASTALQEKPKLYEYHCSLLSDSDGSGSGWTEPPINVEAVIGIKNWVLLQIGEIATLDAWKRHRRAAGNLDVMELARRAMIIKDSLVTNLMQLETEIDPAIAPKDSANLLDIFAQCNCQPSKTSTIQRSLVTHIWAHAALIYLFVVVSGWQPTSVDVRYHVDRIVELLKQLSQPALLRTMVWPFCVAGCVAEPMQEAQLRGMTEALQPSAFGTVHKAFKIMENVWHNRNVGDIATRDLATCFRSQGDLVLLV
ncbi:hypothetical protein NA57DRAFT_31077 [Rhizodiscina lignyota]|uniref:Uncharacterized protein n=1 Tax=Rhizodiscina lignyota TaxID=1504668 RepID=A0A9P4IQS6_9PEZI|nr:hypothetical protein NA57DRAFT_31077 [Rhizodiscina lignyota]